ncbi:MAG: glycoside hydrolase family 2 TIM barrel-domain containing protein, partial [Planctomycetota bacterium]
RGHDLLINGSPVKLRGTNYHITYPGFGEIVSRDKIRRDLELFMDANLNCMRSRPTPSIDFVELCDELGVYTTVEAMVTLMIYAKGPEGDHGANPAIAGPLRHHMATMIESYYSNPSVITWGLGNECPYYDYFKVAAIGMQAADESRPLFFGSDARLGVGIPFMDLNDDHYPRAKHGEMEQPYADLDPETNRVIHDGQWDYPDDRPNLFTEWLHVHTNNWKEVAYDPGIDDIWGYYAKAHLDFMYDTPHYTGGFQFKGAPYRGIGASERWRGVFDGDRRINDIHWHVKKSHSPIRIEPTLGEFDAGAGVARFRVENRHDFLNLNDLTLRWTRGGESGLATADVTPHSEGALEIALGTQDGPPIELEAVAPNGLIVDRYELTLGPPERAAHPAAEGEWSVKETDGEIVVSRGAQRFVVSRETGLITSATLDGRVVLNGSPTASVVPTQQRNFKKQAKFTLVNQMAGWQADRVRADEQGGAVRVVADGRYTLAAGKMVTTFEADGGVTVGCELTWDGKPDLNVFSTGMTLAVAPEFDTLRWERDALWSVYPEYHIGRAEGVAPALGAPEFMSMRDSWNGEGTKPWPWSQDLTSGVTRDFRSTKYRLVEGGLYDAAGFGVEFVGHGTHHLQAVPAGDDLEGNTFVKEIHGQPTPGFHLKLMNYHNGGTEPHLTKSIRLPEEFAKKGWSFEAQATFRLAQP